MAKIHRVIAQVLAKSPGRLTGEYLRFLRMHLGLSGDQLGAYLHTDKTKISKWERGEDTIGQTADRLIRLLAAALDSELRPAVSTVAEHLLRFQTSPGLFGSYTLTQRLSKLLFWLFRRRLKKNLGGCACYGNAR